MFYLFVFLAVVGVVVAVVIGWRVRDWSLPFGPEGGVREYQAPPTNPVPPHLRLECYWDAGLDTARCPAHGGPIGDCPVPYESAPGAALWPPVRPAPPPPPLPTRPSQEVREGGRRPPSQGSAVMPPVRPPVDLWALADDWRQEYRKAAERLRTLELHACAVAKALESAPRTGADHDEPEGARVVTLSDTVARAWARLLRHGKA